MTSGERTHRLILNTLGLLLVLMVILLIILWPYHVLIGFLVLGLIVLGAVLMLGLYAFHTIVNEMVTLHEQKLRQERLRPNDRGYYEIPLDDAKVPMLPVTNALPQEGQEQYSRGYAPIQPKSGRWD